MKALGQCVQLCFRLFLAAAVFLVRSCATAEGDSGSVNALAVNLKAFPNCPTRGRTANPSACPG